MSTGDRKVIIFSWLGSGRFLPLLVSLNLLFFLYSALEGSGTGLLILAGVFSVLMFTGLLAISERRRVVLIGVILVLPALVTRWMHSFGTVGDSHWIYIVGHVSLALFMTYVATIVLIQVLSDRHVTGDTLVGSICVYLLIGFVFAVMFSLVEYLSPESFRVHPALQIESHDLMLNANHFSYMIYYSFVTLTTLGYGDISPLSSGARVLATAEAVGGQIYLAAFVARLVGLHIVWHSNARREKDEIDRTDS